VTKARYEITEFSDPDLALANLLILQLEKQEKIWDTWGQKLISLYGKIIKDLNVNLKFYRESTIERNRGLIESRTSSLHCLFYSVRAYKSIKKNIKPSQKFLRRTNMRLRRPPKPKPWMGVGNDRQGTTRKNGSGHLIPWQEIAISKTSRSSGKFETSGTYALIDSPRMKKNRIKIESLNSNLLRNELGVNNQIRNLDQPEAVVIELKGWKKLSLTSGSGTCVRLVAICQI